MSDRTADDEPLRLTLYVAGRTPRADRTVDDLRAVITDQLDVPSDLQIIDVLERPDLAEEAQILATPTLVKESPRPARRLIGDLSNPTTVLRALGVIAQADQTVEDPET